MEEILKKLREAQRELSDYGKYLEESTYHPYERVQSSARRFGELIDELEKKMDDNRIK